MIEMSLDQIVIQRDGYTILDILSDVGGLQGIFISGISLLLSVLNHESVENYIVYQLYKSQSSTLILSSTEALKLYFIEKVLPSKLVCC